MPHTWVGSDFINAVRSMFVYEDELDQSLALASALYQDWIDAPEGMSVSNLPTYYGELSYAIKMDKERDIIERFRPTIRRNIRKTLRDKDIRVEINERYDEFHPILVDNKARHDVKPTHSYEDLIKLKELMPDYLKLFMVYYKDKPIGGSLMFFPNKAVALCFYNMLNYEYAEYKPI
ncbi:MAG: GNAT family N-acetyltransferase, partial [Bacteroidales bacterium]|nr:GNAT family N-acetyltransferase [Bacteroidales bacterium]